MKKELIEKLLVEYVVKYPGEKSRLKALKNYLKYTNDNDMCDWDNMKGHLTASGFIYSKSTNKFLVLYHNDLKYYYCSGGHCEKIQETPLDTVYQEIKEETSIEDLKLCGSVLPFDIDIHNIPYNIRVNIPSHNHFDFRYLFVIDKECDVTLDLSELSDYKWVGIDELGMYSNYGRTIKKLKEVLSINE